MQLISLIFRAFSDMKKVISEKACNDVLVREPHWVCANHTDLHVARCWRRGCLVTPGSFAKRGEDHKNVEQLNQTKRTKFISLNICSERSLFSLGLNNFAYKINSLSSEKLRLRMLLEMETVSRVLLFSSQSYSLTEAFKIGPN